MCLHGDDLILLKRCCSRATGRSNHMRLSSGACGAMITHPPESQVLSAGTGSSDNVEETLIEKSGACWLDLPKASGKGNLRWRRRTQGLPLSRAGRAACLVCMTCMSTESPTSSYWIEKTSHRGFSMCRWRLQGVSFASEGCNS